MTLPGADTMKGGIMGEDFFRSRAGAPSCTTVGSSDAKREGMVVSAGEGSGVCVACEEVDGRG
jgi:hypothetical protein